MQKILLLSWVMLLAGCQSMGVGSAGGSNPLLIPVGSSITLNQPLNFEIGYSRTHVQFGKSVKPDELRKRYPYCRFYRYEHPDEMQSERSMQPDTFQVTRSYRAMDMPLSGSNGGFGMMPGFNSDGGPPDDNTHNSILKIQSAQQPEIVELRCAVWTEPSINNYLTIAEIQEVLGEVVSIDMP